MTIKPLTEKEQALQNLRNWIKPGDTVYTVLRHVSASGMTRVISLVVIKPGKRGEAPRLIHPNYAAAKVLGWTLTTKHGSDGIRVSGCGMDMGFHLVYTLGRVLWPSKKTDSGYLIRQEWL